MIVKISSGNKKILYYLALIVLVSLLVFFLSAKIKPESVSAFLEKAGFWAPLVFILVIGLTFVFAPISGTPIYFAGFMLFGSRVQIYSYLATILSAAVNFWIAKRWGRSLVSRLVGQKDMTRVDQFAQDYGIKSLILLRIFQGHFNDFISYAYGLTKMEFAPFMIVSIISPIPYLLFWQLYIFPRARSFGDFTIWYVLTLVPFLIISAFFASKMRGK